MNSAIFRSLKEFDADLRQKGFEPNVYREGDWIDASGLTGARVSLETSPQRREGLLRQIQALGTTAATAGLPFDIPSPRWNRLSIISAFGSSGVEGCQM
jgi:hypothetical protein